MTRRLTPLGKKVLVYSLTGLIMALWFLIQSDGPFGMTGG